jgi:hypothetical protein
VSTVNLALASSSDTLVPLVLLGGTAALIAAIVLANWVVTNRRRKAYE